ncbi:hypothetical protein [Streptomyces fungicidicus]|uniref:hypothetical protein n=1 Tax=Streptomyces fungicidicus TaxID=68203 RepID=UPI00367E4DF1
MRLHRVAPGAAAGTAPALPLATPSLRRHGGHAALDDNTPEALRHFLEVGDTRSPDRHGAAPQRAARQAL